MSKGKPYPHYCPSGQTNLSENNVAYGEEGVELTLVRKLSLALETKKNPDWVSISWASQKEAMEYFNEHGFEETLSKLMDLGDLD